ncbi:MAG: hypothetical protein RL405_548 [Actinomycetota bacterium]|jgi:hypothetical protein
MLFLTESDFIDVVKEEQFDDVVTVSASSPLALAKFKHHSENEIVVNTDNFAFPFAVYVTRESAAHLLKCSRVYSAETVANFSPEPVAYCFRGYDSETEDPTWGYCWPDDVEHIRFGIVGVKDMNFYPLFEVPAELQESLNERG